MLAIGPTIGLTIELSSGWICPIPKRFGL